MSAQANQIDFRESYVKKTTHLVVGLMSGTSLDGVDAALVEIKTNGDSAIESARLIKHTYLPYTNEVREAVARLCAVESAKIDDLVYAHFGLSEWYAEASLGVIREAGVPRSNIDAICMHGQTVWHAPIPRPFPGPTGSIPVKGTLQLGSCSVVRERTGIPVIADLRERDMAAGGEGAPLTPYVDAILFGSREEGRIIQNIGGIGNATVIGAGSAARDVYAFDTGPGNMIIDAVVAIGTEGQRRYDSEGSFAAKGKVSSVMVEELMADPYFSRQPPKSTGREIYGENFARQFISDAEKKGLSFEDTVATATAFTATSIVQAYHDFVLPKTPIARILACGGGALNNTLLRMIRERLPRGIEVTTTAAFGVPDQAREAMAFAILGHESLMGRENNLPAVTGAGTEVVLGVLTL